MHSHYSFSFGEKHPKGVLYRGGTEDILQFSVPGVGQNACGGPVACTTIAYVIANAFLSINDTKEIISLNQKQWKSLVQKGVKLYNDAVSTGTIAQGHSYSTVASAQTAMRRDAKLGSIFPNVGSKEKNLIRDCYAYTQALTESMGFVSNEGLNFSDNVTCPDLLATEMKELELDNDGKKSSKYDPITTAVLTAYGESLAIWTNQKQFVSINSHGEDLKFTVFENERVFREDTNKVYREDYIIVSSGKGSIAAIYEALEKQPSSFVSAIFFKTLIDK